MFWLKLKKYGLWIVLGVAFVIAILPMIIDLVLPSKTVSKADLKKPEPPKKSVVPNFVKALQDAQKVNDEKIQKLSRAELIDSINADAEKRKS